VYNDDRGIASDSDSNRREMIAEELARADWDSTALARPDCMTLW